jgi:hypothetical protein
MHDERGGTLLSSFWYACVLRIVGASKSQFCCRPSRAVRNELVPCLRVLGLEGGREARRNEVRRERTWTLHAPSIKARGNGVESRPERCGDPMGRPCARTCPPPHSITGQRASTARPSMRLYSKRARKHHPRSCRCRSSQPPRWLPIPVFRLRMIRT